jgi:hypothetical protein
VSAQFSTHLEHLGQKTGSTRGLYLQPLISIVNLKKKAESKVRLKSVAPIRPIETFENKNENYERRVLVKLLKATSSLGNCCVARCDNQTTNSLNSLSFVDCEEPFCVVEIDNPVQKQITNVFKYTSSIDEQFLFDITNISEEITFSIYDRSKNYGRKCRCFTL